MENFPNNENKTETVSLSDIEDLIESNLELKELHVPENLKNIFNSKSDNWLDLLHDCEERQYPELKKHLLYILRQRKFLEWDISGLKESDFGEAIVCIEELEASRNGEKLGAGASGIVFVERNDVSCCVKFLHSPEMASNSIAEELELLDAVAGSGMQTLKFPYPHLIINNVDKSKSFYTMDRVFGLDFNRIIKEEDSETAKTKLESVFGIKTQVLEFLEKIKDSNFVNKLLEDVKRMHNADVIHSDLNAGNVMFDKSGDIYIIDFGMSKKKENIEEYKIAAEQSKDVNDMIRNIKLLIEKISNVYNLT